MFKHIRSVWGSWLVLGLLALGVSVGAVAQQGREPAEVEALKKASVNGKYSKLLVVIHVPGDQATYTNFHDYGVYNGTSWAGYTGLPKGYWVYVAPHWYIWEQQGQGGVGAPAAPAGDQAKASVNGKYTDLLKVINVPGDQATYGAFNDYGYYTGTSWAGYNNLPVGYWVYVAPNWYIWGKQGQQQQQPPAGGGADQQKAAVNGKYANLLKVINVPGDQQSYGAFYDWGHWTGTSWAGYDNLPQGYWVYVAPNWYIWGQQWQGQLPPQGQPQPPQEQPKLKPAPDGQGAPAQASVNGKYTKLLKVINVPGDQTTYGQFTDYGFYSGTSWAGYENLPPGYWVYVAPNWYIWGESQGAK